MVKKTYFEGDIRKINPYAFGFFCKFEAPKDLMYLIIQLYVNTTKSLNQKLITLFIYNNIIFNQYANYLINHLFNYKVYSYSLS